MIGYSNQRLWAKILVRGHIIHADAKDLGVKALIEIEISLMPI